MTLLTVLAVLLSPAVAAPVSVESALGEARRMLAKEGPARFEAPAVGAAASVPCHTRPADAEADAAGAPASVCLRELRVEGGSLVLPEGPLAGTYKLEREAVGRKASAVVYSFYEGSACSDGRSAALRIAVVLDASGRPVRGSEVLTLELGATGDVCHSGWYYRTVEYRAPAAVASSSPWACADPKAVALPAELNARVLAEVRKSCPAFGLSEVRTTVCAVRVDQDSDLYFTTELTGSWNFDGMHPVGGVKVLVESAEYAFSNGDNLEVRAPSSPNEPEVCGSR